MNEHPTLQHPITTGVILAAGMARRLRPLTNDRPKCLLPLGHRNLLERTVDAMRMVGVERLVVVTGFKAEMIRDFLLARYPQMEIIFIDNTDYANNNNIYSLWMAGKVVRDEEFLLMDSDIYCDPQAVAAVAQQEGSALALNRHPLGEEEMKIVVDGEGRITEISKTCRIEDAVGESVGIEKFSPAYSQALYRELDTMILEEGLIDIFYERGFERLIPQGHTFKVVDTTPYLSYELDTVEDYEHVKALLKEQGEETIE